MGTPRAVVSLLILAASLAAQEPPRDGIFGEVKGRDGKVFAGALVTLLHVAHPALVDAQYVDRVTATTDERGRFRAELLAGMQYVVWATASGADGTYRCTDVATDVLAGVPVLLREDEPRWRRRVRLQIDPSWQAPLQFFASCRVGPFLLREPQAVVDGVAVLPEWPGTSITVAGIAEDQNVFLTGFSTTLGGLRSARTASAKTSGTAPPDDEALLRELSTVHDQTVGPRTEYTLRFVDADGKPVPGVRLAAEMQEPRDQLGTSGDDGVVRVLLAGDRKLHSRMIATGEACAETSIADGDLHATADGKPSDKRLERGTTLRGRLLLGDDQPAANVALLLEGSICTGPGSTYFGVRTRVCRSDAKGTFAIPGRVDSHQFSVAAVLTPAQRARWMAEPKAAPVAPLALIVPPTTGAAHATARDIRLDRLAPIDLHVTGPDGGTPGPAHVIVSATSNAPFGGDVYWPLRATTDRLGRLRLLAVADAEVAVFVMTKAGAASLLTRAGAPPQELRLDSRRVVQVRIVDVEQKPMAGATVSIIGPQSAPFGAQPGLAQAASRVFHVNAFPLRSAKTDDEGRVALVTPVDGRLDVIVHRDGKSMRLNVTPVADKPLEITFEPNNR